MLFNKLIDDCTVYSATSILLLFSLYYCLLSCLQFVIDIKSEEAQSSAFHSFFTSYLEGILGLSSRSTAITNVAAVNVSTAILRHVTIYFFIECLLN